LSRATSDRGSGALGNFIAGGEREKTFSTKGIVSGRRSGFGRESSPVAVHVAGAKGEAVVHQGGVDHDTLLGPIQQVAQVAQVAKTPAHPVPSAVLVQTENLAGTEPTLKYYR